MRFWCESTVKYLQKESEHKISVITEWKTSHIYGLNKNKTKIKRNRYFPISKFLFYQETIIQLWWARIWVQFNNWMSFSENTFSVNCHHKSYRECFHFHGGPKSDSLDIWANELCTFSKFAKVRIHEYSIHFDIIAYPVTFSIKWNYMTRPNEFVYCIQIKLDC